MREGDGVELEHFFSGNALAHVGAGGEIRLPPFVLSVLARRGGSERIVFGAHDCDPCLTAFDAALLPAIGEEIERLKQRDEVAGEDRHAHAGRARRAFGLNETAAIGEDGRVALPLFLRRRGQIGARALFVGAGPRVEIWDVELARASDDPALRALAEFRLEGQEEE